MRKNQVARALIACFFPPWSEFAVEPDDCDAVLISEEGDSWSPIKTMAVTFQGGLLNVDRCNNLRQCGT